MRRAALLATLVLLTAGLCAQESVKRAGNITETDSELLWRNRFAQCDYGVLVLLPKDFVGHGDKPPSPIHGIVVNLPDTAGLRVPDVEKDERVMGVSFAYASYLDNPSLKDVADYEIDLSTQHHSSAKVTRRKDRLQGVPAVRFRVEYQESGKEVIEDEIVALRAGIVYQVWLRTTDSDYVEDAKQFERLVAGFRFWRIHYC